MTRLISSRSLSLDLACTKKHHFRHSRLALASLGGFPQRVHLLQRRALGGLAALGQSVLDRLEPTLEPGGRIDQGVLGVDPDLASYVHDSEQKVAELVVDRGGVAAADRLGRFADLLLDLGERPLPARPVEPDLGRPGPDLLGAGEGGAGLDAGEDAVAPAGGGLLRALDLV